MATPDPRASRAVVLEDHLDLNAHDRAQLEQALERSLEQARIGDTMSAEETFAWLRDRREAAVLEQALLESVTEEMTSEEQAALDAAIDESYADMEAGRTRRVQDVIAELRARTAQRAAG